MKSHLPCRRRKRRPHESGRTAASCSVYPRKEHARMHAAHAPLRKALLRPPHQLTHRVPCRARGSGHQNCRFSQKRSRARAERYSPALLASLTVSSHMMLRKEYICGRLKVNRAPCKYRTAAFLNGLKRCTIYRGPGRPEAVPAPRHHIYFRVLGREGSSRGTCS